MDRVSLALSTRTDRVGPKTALVAFNEMIELEGNTPRDLKGVLQTRSNALLRLSWNAPHYLVPLAEALADNKEHWGPIEPTVTGIKAFFERLGRNVASPHRRGAYQERVKGVSITAPSYKTFRTNLRGGVAKRLVKNVPCIICGQNSSLSSSGGKRHSLHLCTEHKLILTIALVNGTIAETATDEEIKELLKDK